MGTLDYPTEFQGADPATLATLGVSKIITISSTYDHRIIQGAESGLFLKRVHELLLGADGFYDDIFRSIGVPYEAVQWRRDVRPVDHEHGMLEKQMRVDQLVNAHRVRGHLIADLDPLAAKDPVMHPELDPATYGLTIWDLDREFLTSGIGGSDRRALGDLLHLLRDAYCRTIGIEYMHIQEPLEKAWIQREVEGVTVTLSPDEHLHILARLNAAEALEKFLATKYLGQKRFGIDGAESAIPILDAILSEAADGHLDSSVIGMAHRGRLNVLVNIVGKSYEQLFKEFEGNVDPESTQGSGDVKYHLGQTGKFVSRTGNTIEVDLAANPSHLETVDPVVEGLARAKMDLIQPPGHYPVLPILIHGDAAFAGQGVVAETLNLSLIKGYRVGGTIHLIINNQLGFTTPPDSARSSEYPTDVAKMVQAPIFHVNGDDPEACVRVARLAFAYRQEFNKDVVIDMVCYRRHGHNEGDDPSYTQPQMYKRIDARRSVRKLYTEALVKRGDISLDEAEAALDDFQNQLQTALEDTRLHAPPEGTRAKPSPPAAGVLPHVETGISRDEVDTIFRALETVPEGFVVHPKLAKQFETRARMFADGEVDWALGEAMAFGSLLYEGTSVRLAGQDSRRGTFSHRHGVLVDYETGEEYTPLAGAGRAGHPVLALRLPAVGVRRARLRVRLLGGQQGRAGHVGGAVRRLHQRGPDHHRPVPGGRRGQVGPDLGPGHAVAPRLRGPGPRALVGPHRALLDAGRRGQHPGVQRHHRRAVLPPPAPPDEAQRAQAADRVHPQVAAAGQGVAIAHRGAHPGLVRGGAGRPVGGRPRRGQAGGVRLGQGRLRRAGRPRRPRRPGGGGPGRAAVPVAVRRGGRRCWIATRTPTRSSGSRRSRRTWARGTPSRVACTRPTAPPTGSTVRAGPSRARPPPAPTPSTSRSSRSCSTASSPASD